MNKRIEAVAKLLKVGVLTKLPDVAPYLSSNFVGGALLARAAGEATVFTMMYEEEYTHGKKKEKWLRGVTGFVYAGATFNFDQYGVGDSWYPDDFGWGKTKPKPATAAEIVAKMEEQLVEATRRAEAHIARKKAGKVINFGPVSRTLLPDEIEKFKARLAARKSFEFRPSGFGNGYRFFIGRSVRYGGGVASEEARAIFGEGLIYETMDCD